MIDDIMTQKCINFIKGSDNFVLIAVKNETANILMVYENKYEVIGTLEELKSKILSGEFCGKEERQNDNTDLPN